MGIHEKISIIQANLNAPKSQYNKFGKYNYRSCEDILEALKPLLKEHKMTISISDQIKLIGDRYYVEATARVIDYENDSTHFVTSYAREASNKKGMDDSQITGAASSYARKYALNGLFAIDDAKDADSTNDHGKGNNASRKQKKKPSSKSKKPSKKKGSGDKATKNQLKAIYAIANDKAVDIDIVKEYMSLKLNRESSKDLTKTEASRIIDYLQEDPEGLIQHVENLKES